MEPEKLATASAAGLLGIICGIWLVLAGILFLGFGVTYVAFLAPLMASNIVLVYLCAILNFVFAGIMMVGGILVYNFKYRQGGAIITIMAVISIIVGGGFYISTLWGLAAGIIAMICPNLEEKINERRAKLA